MIIFHNTQMITALTFQCTAHYMFGVQHHRGNTLMAAFMHRYPITRDTGMLHTTAGTTDLGTKTNAPDVPILLDWKWCHWVEKVVAFLHSHVSVFLRRGLDRKRYSLSSPRFWPQRRSSNARADPQRHEKIACLAASSNARRDFEVASTSCTSLHNDVVASRIRAYGVPCRSKC